LASFSAAELDARSTYRFLIGSVVPRPIAWVSTVSENGGRNIAPFSFFTVASTAPPMLCISIGLPESPKKSIKDTLQGIEETREFVVNIATVDLLDELVASAAVLPIDVDEFAFSGLTSAASDLVLPPRIAAAPISMECVLYDSVKLGTDVLVIGEVVRFHFREGVLDENLRVRLGVLRPLGRLAGPYFATEFNSVKEVPPSTQ